MCFIVHIVLEQLTQAREKVAKLADKNEIPPTAELLPETTAATTPEESKPKKKSITRKAKAESPYTAPDVASTTVSFPRLSLLHPM